MTNLATLPIWLKMLEDEHGGSVRKAAAHFDIEPSYWWRLKSGEMENPSQEILDKLGLTKAAVLYSKVP